MNDVGYEYKTQGSAEYRFHFRQIRTDSQADTDRPFGVRIEEKGDGGVSAEVWDDNEGRTLFSGVVYPRGKRGEHTFNNIAEIEAFAKQLVRFVVECKFNVKDYASALV